MPDTSTLGLARERFDADLPLLSDPTVQRWLAVGGLAIVALGAGIYFFRRSRR